MTTANQTGGNPSNGLSRRNFIKGAAASIAVSMFLPIVAGQKASAKPAPATEELTANAFIRIASDNTVTVLIKHIEFGQGTYTGLATLAAEELDADWAQVRAEHAPADVKLYANSLFGIQGTGGSTAIASSYMTMRKAGATARVWLVNAAAKKWQVPSDSLTVSQGVVSHKASGKSASFGELVAVAATLPAPTTEPKLKSPEQFNLIGRDIPKLDTEDKSSGQAIYTMDVQKDDMVVAVVAHPPAFGATVKSFDAAQSKKVPGVIDVKAVGSGVAIYANSTFNAIKGKRVLQVEWDFSKAETRDSKQLFKDFGNALKKPGLSVVDQGDKTALNVAKSSAIEVEFNFPYLAHAPMETLDAVMQFKDGKVTAWFGSQLVTVDQGAIAQVFGVGPQNVDIRTQLAGGSFGRRAQQDSGLAVEAAQVTKAFGKPVPVKLVWTREDDIQGGRYRPMSVHKLKGAVDQKGNVVGWHHHVAIQSLLANSPFAGMIQNGVDVTSIEGAQEPPYGFPVLSLELTTMEVGVPVLWWRSVGHTHTAYAIETAIDALLEKVEKDPVEGRLALMQNHPRERNVLKLVATMADKAGKTPSGRARGVAVVKSFSTYVAQIAEVSKGQDGKPKVHRVWCAVDCGLAVNTNVVKAQLEGGIGYGLDAALHGEVTLGDKGKVNQSNFHDYKVLRINEAPAIEVEIVKSAEPPTGVGEPGVPPIAPAVANAWRRLTGQYITTLPFDKGVQV